MINAIENTKQFHPTRPITIQARILYSTKIKVFPPKTAFILESRPPQLPYHRNLGDEVSRTEQNGGLLDAKKSMPVILQSDEDFFLFKDEHLKDSQRHVSVFLPWVGLLLGRQHLKVLAETAAGLSGLQDVIDVTYDTNNFNLSMMQ